MWLKKEGGEDEQKSSEIKKRLIGAIPDFIAFLLLILCFRFFGGRDGTPWSWQEILIDLPMLIIVYLILTFIRG